MSRTVSVKKIEDAYTVVLDAEGDEEAQPLMTVMLLDEHGACALTMHEAVVTLCDEYHFRHLIEAQAEAFFRARNDR